MPTPRIAVAVAAFGKPFRKALQSVQQSGATAVQLTIGLDLRLDDMTDSGRRQLLHELSECQLNIGSLNVPMQRGLSDLDGLDRRIDELKRALQLAYQLKTQTVSFRIGRIPDPSKGTPYETLLAVLNDLARHSNYVGAVPSITPSGDSIDRIAELLAGVTEGPIAVTLDPAVVVPAGYSAAKLFRELVGAVDQVLIRDAVRDIDDAVTEVPVGRGEVEWDELLSLVSEAEFRGWLTVVRTQGDDKAGDALRAVSFVRNVLAD